MKGISCSFLSVILWMLKFTFGADLLACEWEKEWLLWEINTTMDVLDPDVVTSKE